MSRTHPLRIAPLLTASLTALGLLVLLAHPLQGEEPSVEQCAERLQRSTLTVRIRMQAEPTQHAVKLSDVAEAQNSLNLPAKQSYQQTIPAQSAQSDSEFLKKRSDLAANQLDDNSSLQVSVCSGTAISKKFVVTAAYAAADSQIRLTHPGGKQTDARLRVLDEFSGLLLLETADETLEPLEFAERPPAAGAWVMSASAWGSERPLVSIGHVGGLDRTLKSVVFPPLLQCDVRPTETSCGSGLIDRQGRLLGVIVAADGPVAQSPWVYAVGVSHVQRLLRAWAGKSRDDSVVVLKRRRPTVGLMLDSDDDGVKVSRVSSESPAGKAGIVVGDRIIAADAIAVRSVYDAIRPTLSKQPGDTMSLTVKRGSEEKTVEFTLGGGVELPGATQQVLGGLVQPKVDLGLSNMNGNARAAGQQSASSPRMNDVRIRNYYSDLPAEGEVKESPVTRGRSTEDRLERSREIIVQQQAELERLEQERMRQLELIEILRGELEAMKKEKK